MSLKLSGPQMQTFVAALADAYSLGKLKMMLTFRLNKDLEDFEGGGRAEKIFDLVKTSNQEGWVGRLLEAARASNPENAALVTFQELLGLTSVSAEVKGGLEKIVNERSHFVDVMRFRERLGRLETWICAIESPLGGGTGFLVGPDLVLTNYHVVQPYLNGNAEAASVRCRFDFKKLPEGTTVNEGRCVGLAATWDVAHSPYSAFDNGTAAASPTSSELDYAVVRLAEPIGAEPIGEKPDPEAPARGSLNLASEPATALAGDPIFVLQHPMDLAALPKVGLQPMQLAIGKVMGFVADGLRLRHDTRTLPGSSGSPCLNADLELVALHHAGEPKSRLDYKGEYNQAIPIGRIVQHLREKKVPAIGATTV